MTRALKVTGIGIGSIVGLVAVLIAALLLFVDPNNYKPQITSVAKDKTDMELALNDKLEWKLWPSIGVKLGHASLTDPQSKEQLFAVNQAAVSVQLMPLFSKKIAIDAVDLDGAQVRFVQHADGTTSWDRMLAKLKSPKAPEEKSAPVQIKVKSLDVKNTALTLIDEKTKTTREVKNVTVQASDIGPDSTFPLSAQFLFTQQDGSGKTVAAQNDIAAKVRFNEAMDQFALSGLKASSDLSGSLLPAPATITLQGDAIADLKTQQHKVDKLVLNIDYKDPALAKPATVQLTANVVADMAKQLVSVSGLTLDAAYPAKNLKSPASAKLSAATVTADLGKNLLSIGGLKAQASYPDSTRQAPITAALSTDVQTQWLDGSVSLPNLAVNAEYPDKAFPKPLSLSLSSAISGNWKQGQLSLPQFVAKVLGVEARGKLEAKLPALAATAKPGTPLLSGMSASGNIATNAFNPRGIMSALGIAAPKTQDANVLSSASVSSDIVGNDNSLLLKNLRVKLDGTSLSGDAGVSDLKSFRLYARLNLDKINVDSYLPPTAPSVASNKPAASNPNAPVLPVDLLKKQNMDVALSAGALTVMGYPITQLSVAATADRGLVNVGALKGSIYSGSFSLPASINVQGAQPVIDVKPTISQIEIGPIAQQVLKKDLFTGKFSYNGALRLSGNTVDAWKRSLNGTSSIKLQNGVMHGVNMMQLVLGEFSKYQGFITALTGKDATTIANSQSDTPIAELDSDATITNGLVTQKTINADLQKAKLTGSGTFNLPTLDADYRLGVTLDRSVAGAKYAGYAVPMRCKGNVSAPAKLCGVDGSAVKEIVAKAALSQGLEKLGLPAGTDVNGAKQQAQQQMQQQVDQQKQKAQDQLKQKLNQGLQNLFGK